ncbi:hypothetical protein [Dictyobacter formicarum]|uniref:Phasin domain-containing protein n=1 Tax=Dictyobacter formicarum TaxID=2778368 RepID=A0ABQ3VHZ6_9CHLR|nr:hypothetical protein [Dictyobacter formicarum]GHO85805.1 hypothetical protein KSZ_38110 [Dictyobacter formicarum]
MTQTRESDAAASAIRRAEQIATVTGGQLGAWVGLTTQRFRQATQALREEANRLDTPGSAMVNQTTAGKSATGQPRPAQERAEALIDQLGQWTREGGAHMQRTLARLREDAEDMYVEAQDMRSMWRDHRTTVV